MKSNKNRNKFKSLQSMKSNKNSSLQNNKFNQNSNKFRKPQSIKLNKNLRK